MKCLILAAGYATRLYPITENFPKPLLMVGEKTILDYLIDDISCYDDVDEFIVISNHKYIEHFETWAKQKKVKITPIDDGTYTNETRLGAVKDIQFSINKCNINDDILVIAGDNVLDFSLTEFIAYSKDKKSSCIMRYYEPEEKNLRRTGIVEVDENDLVLSMEEKPDNPKTHWVCPPFYYFLEKDIKRISEGINSGCGTDAPGSYISWLSKNAEVYAMEMPGNRYDIGNLESYEKVKREYKGIIK